MTKATHISYGTCRTCYEVQVIAGNQIIDSYTGYNSPYDSTLAVVDSPYSTQQMMDFAKSTAMDMAKENNVPTNRVTHDPDIDAHLRDEYDCQAIV